MKAAMRGPRTDQVKLVSMPEEQLILVDEHNRAVGRGGKVAVHRRGLLHRAFSIFLVDSRGRLLLQQRHPQKYHSGGLWANSCCGHPRPGDKTIAAAHRRLYEELGVDVPLTLGFFARYRCELDHDMQENEFVYVYFGRLSSPLNPNPTEIAQVAFTSVPALARRSAREPASFTVWLRHYMRDHGRDIARLAQTIAQHSTG